MASFGETPAAETTNPVVEVTEAAPAPAENAGGDEGDEGMYCYLTPFSFPPAYSYPMYSFPHVKTMMGVYHILTLR